MVAAPDAEVAVRVRMEALKTELYTRDPPCAQMSKLHGAIERAAKQVDAKKEVSAASLAAVVTVGDFRLALRMKHPHDVIDQMDLDSAMSGVFRAVPHLPDSEKLERIQVFTDGSAMLKSAWQGLDALIGFLGDTVQTHQQHPQYLGARVRTISTAELSAIITTLATVLRACSKPPELDFLSDSVFSIKVLQRHWRASSNVVQCGRALVVA